MNEHYHVRHGYEYTGIVVYQVEDHVVLTSYVFHRSL